MKLISAAGLIVALGAGWAGAADYYFSPSGNDGWPGTQAQPFATIGKLNALNLNAGDRVLFQGGATFNGNIKLDSGDSGSDSSGNPAGNPIKITSYGTGRATIRASNGSGYISGAGLYANNVGNIEISKLDFVGSGNRWDAGLGKWVFDNKGSGIRFENNLGGDTKLKHVVIEDVRVSSFGERGIYITAVKNPSTGSYGANGYSDVRMTRVEAHHNEEGGIGMDGNYQSGAQRNSFTDVVVEYSLAWDNPGRDKVAAGEGHSGSGIVLGQVNRGAIRYSVAHHNAYRCDSTAGGAVGIWFWDSQNSVIEHNEAYANKTAASHDGGGFDLDGGVITSVMQYNYSHDNDGAGYLLCEYPGARPFDRNVVRYNISVNDGRKNGYGGVVACAGGALTNIDVYNNTVYLTRSGGSKQPAAINFRSSQGSSFRVSNNLLIIQHDSDSSTAEPLPIAGTTAATIRRNAYWNSGRTDYTYSADPMPLYLSTSKPMGLVGPVGQDPTYNDATKIVNLSAYKTAAGSPLIGAGLDLMSAFGVNAGPVDYYGNARSTPGNIGAHEGGAAAPVTYTLSVSAVNGSVSRSPSQSSYASGASVTLTATPASGYQFVSWSGDLGGSANPATIAMTSNKSVTANFSLIPTAAQSVAGLTLINAATDAELGALTDGRVLDLSVLGNQLNVRADTSPSLVGSVVFTLDGAVYATESAAPYALGGNDGADYKPWTPSAGTHVLIATPYTGSGGTGTAGTPRKVTFTVVQGLSLAGFTLIDANTSATLGALTQDRQLDLGKLGKSLNVRAEPGSGAIGSVMFYLDGVFARTENIAPYSYAGNTLDGSGYLPWTPPLGTHTMMAVPYSGSQGTGTRGQALSVRFSVISGSSLSLGSGSLVTMLSSDGRRAPEGSAPRALMLSAKAASQVLEFSPEVTEAAITSVKGEVLAQASRSGTGPMSIRFSGGAAMPSGLCVISMKTASGRSTQFCVVVR